MADWRTMTFHGCRAISRLAATFEIGPPLPEPIPFASFSVRVLERRDGTFAAVPTVAVRGLDGFADAYAGLGDTIDEALAEALAYFWSAVQERGAKHADDFVWASQDDA